MDNLGDFKMINGDNGLGLIFARVLGPSLGPLKGLYLFTLFGVAVAAALRGAIFSIVYKNTFDGSILNMPLWSMAFLVLVLLATALLQRYLHYRFKVCNRHISARIRGLVFEKMCRSSVLALEKNHSASIQACLNSDIPALESIYATQLSSLVNTTICGSLAMVIIFLLDYRLALIGIALNVLGCVVSGKLTPILRKNSEIALESQAKLLEIIASAFYGAKELRLFPIGNQLYGRFAASNSENGAAILKNSKIEGVIQGIQFAVKSISTMGILMVGLTFLIHDQITLGVIVAILVQQDAIAFMFSNFSTYTNGIQKSLVAGERVLQLLDMEEEGTGTGAGDGREKGREVGLVKIPPANPYIIEMVNINFSREGRRIIKDYHLRAKPNEVITIAGESGSGKSTIIKLLLGFYKADGGYIHIDGKAISAYTIHELRAKIAYLPQDAYLFCGTILENIALGSPDQDLSIEAVMEAAQNAGAHDFIMKLPRGYSTMVDESSTNLSGGERQRIAIARAFLKDAPILLLDEPTSALDPASADLVMQSLHRLMHNRTVLMVTHQL